MKLTQRLRNLKAAWLRRQRRLDAKHKSQTTPQPDILAPAWQRRPGTIVFDHRFLPGMTSSLPQLHGQPCAVIQQKGDTAVIKLRNGQVFITRTDFVKPLHLNIP